MRMSHLVRNVGSFLQKSTHILCNNFIQTSNTIPMQTPVWVGMTVRTNIRNNFPKAKEGKRIKISGWQTRMSTPEGRRVLMRRILKGRHVLSH